MCEKIGKKMIYFKPFTDEEFKNIQNYLKDNSIIKLNKYYSLLSKIKG